MTVKPTWQSSASIGAVAENDFDSSVSFADSFQHELRAVLILNGSSMDNHRQKQAKRIHGDVPLPTGHLFSAVKSTLFATFGRANRLAVDDCRGGCRLLSFCFSYLLTKPVMNLNPGAIFDPAAEDPVNGLPRPEIFGDVAPLAPCAIPVDCTLGDCL